MPNDFQLIYRGNAIPLKHSALIGRSMACAVVLEGSKVSRRHAKLVVDGDTVSIEDLGSSNGVYVNGERVDGTRALSDGDELTVGAHILQFIAKERVETESRRSSHPLVRRSAMDSLWDDDDEDLDDGISTGSGDGLELAGPGVQRLLDHGDIAGAEETLAPQLNHILSAAKSSGDVDQQAMDSATVFALKLAAAGAGMRWLVYPLLLHTAMETVMSKQAANQLSEQLGASDVEAKIALGRYVDMLKAREAGLTSPERTTLQQLEQLMPDNENRITDT